MTPTTLLRVVNHALKTDSEMTLSRLKIFLLIARHDGVLVKELMTQTGLQQSTIARQLSILTGSRSTRGGSGTPMAWVEMRPDPSDPRRVQCFLTNQGKQAMSEFETLME